MYEKVRKIPHPRGIDCRFSSRFSQELPNWYLGIFGSVLVGVDGIDGQHFCLWWVNNRRTVRINDKHHAPQIIPYSPSSPRSAPIARLLPACRFAPCRVPFPLIPPTFLFVAPQFAQTRPVFPSGFLLHIAQNSPQKFEKRSGELIFSSAEVARAPRSTSKTLRRSPKSRPQRLF